MMYSPGDHFPEQSLQLNADGPNEYCSADYGRIDTVTSILYSLETQLCGL